MYFNVPRLNKLSMLVNTALGGMLLAVMKIRLNLLLTRVVNKTKVMLKEKKYSCLN